MFPLEYYQNYWWIIISLLAGVLVFMLFVQGGQTMLLTMRNRPNELEMTVDALGRKWELTFTTLVVFGGAFFASFPLFYSTSFGGAYWLWMILLFSFIVQAVSYEFRRKRGNLYGTRTYDIFLFINGCVGCIVLGVIVAMMFFGAEFTVQRANLLDAGTPVISQWAPTHGLEALADWRCLVLGVAILFLARTLAALYFMNAIRAGSEYTNRNRCRVLINGSIFVVFFLGFVALLLLTPGQTAISPDGTGLQANSFEWTSHKYLHNLLGMWWVGLLFVVGVLAVLYGAGRAVVSSDFRYGLWIAGAGVVLVVMSLFWIAGFNGTPYYPSLIETSSSLSIRNSSSTRFTLEVMTVVSLIIPFVLAYIAYVWWSMSRKPITPQSETKY